MAGHRPRCVAMLRGINLGSHNRISMPDLRAAFAATGLGDVETYVQSGNVIFDGGRAKDTALEQQIRELIADSFGLDVPVLIVKANPFLRDGAAAGRLYVTFLGSTPDPAQVKQLGPGTDGRDEWRVAGREIYLHCPIDYGHSKLTNAFFERKLGVTATTRNWKSTLALAELAAG